MIRGVSGYLKLGGQVVMWRATAAAPPPGGAFYFAKNWVGNCPPCPPTTYAPGIKPDNFDQSWLVSSPSNEETIIMENHGIKTIVHEMKVNGHHLVERKTMERKQKTPVNPNAFDNRTRMHCGMNIITHSRSIDDR